ncbi:F-box/kelch-repeat protein At3g06240-like [Quercus robur]|uniref:F-box/kelch-repeat protein At3g06240-like n=1 Tax=Quercus robur TaxID=38942 RepID=UPI0021625DDD|nr:F-box/kelch-repeat protein At3g06240-like [Quercus robur]
MSQTRKPRTILQQRKNHLPDHLVLNIFANLPVKSVLRFRCLSKTWYSSLATPNFISTHLHHHRLHDDAYLIHMPPDVSYPSYDLRDFGDDDDDDDDVYVPTTVSSRLSKSNTPICCMVARDSATFNEISEYPVPSAFHLSSFQIVGSCNGLVCVAQYGCSSTIAHAIYLWNPSIRKFKRLPDFSLTRFIWISTGFAYQSETNDYKVVKISYTRHPTQLDLLLDREVEIEIEKEAEAEVYTLSSNSWRRVGISLRKNVKVSCIKDWPATFVCGALHWLGAVSDGEAITYHNMILSFDVNNDKFGEIVLPCGRQLLPQGLVVPEPNCLMEVKGKLAFITFGCHLIDDNINDNYNEYLMMSDRESCFIWVMGEYGVHKSWSKLFFVRFEEVFDLQFFGCNSSGELLVRKEVERDTGRSRKDYKMWWRHTDYYVIVSLEPETLHEKDLGIQNVELIATNFMESLVLLDEATELSG